MKCQICGDNAATIVFTKIVNNEKAVLHVCGECAKKKGIMIELGHSQSVSTKSVDLTSSSHLEHGRDIQEPDLTCKTCGLLFEEFRKTGFLGCDACYETFGRHVANILKQIHGSAVHQGKVPLNLAGNIDLKNHLHTLRHRLKRCIDAEEYESAAELRDKIASLEGKIMKDDI